jgi:hypothetical protein
MSRQIHGLSGASESQQQPSDGEYLVRVARAQYRWDKRKPYYSISFEILEPASARHKAFVGRIYCSPKALWKLNWFLRDFGYDPELLGRDELDEGALIGLRGVVKLSRKNLDDRTLLNLDAFSHAEQWPEIESSGRGAEAA